MVWVKKIWRIESILFLLKQMLPEPVAQLMKRLSGVLARNKIKMENHAYHQWLKRVAPDPEHSEQRLQSLTVRPFFSFILPVYNTRLHYLKETVDSIFNQTYTHFEVCISDDGSTDEDLILYLKQLSEKHTNIRLILGKSNKGIAANSNRAIRVAVGDYFVFCDHDDRIESFSLELFALYINQFPHAELFYSDEDLMDSDGCRHSPRLQPDWNPDMFTSHMYFMHLICCKRETLAGIGFMNSEFDGAQDYDFFLRVTEQARQIIHIPMILYSWRIASDSLAADPMTKIYAYSSGTQALENAMKRRGEDAIVTKGQGAGLGVYRVKRKVGDPSVSHIVAGQAKDMWDAIKSISSVSSIPVEIIAVVEDSTGIPSEALERYGNVKVVVVAEKSNRATKYNIGARHASHRHLIFSSGEIEILDSDYPIAILEHTQRSEIGAVGVKLIYPDGRFYHTGMILGINGVAGYAYRNVFQGPGHWRFAVVIRNFSAVSWDLMGVDKNKYEEAGGFDEQLSAYADIDFCLKLIRRGYRNLYTPYVAGVLKKNIHSLEALRDAAAERVIMGRYGEDVRNDPCYHPLCTKGREDFTLDWDAHRFDYRSALESMARFNP